MLSRIQTSPDNYVITSPKEIKVLEKSFAELDLFTDDQTRTTILWNFVKKLQSNPYETTMNTFSKVTNTFREYNKRK